MVMRRANFSNLIAPGLNKVFFDEHKARTSEYETIFNVRTSKKAYETDFQMAGIGTMPAKPEGTATQYEDFLPWETKVYTHVSYGKGVRITREMQDDDLYGQMKKGIQQLAKSARFCLEVGAWSILNNAFNILHYGFDPTQSLCDSAHPRIGPGLGTLGNAPSTHCDLSLTSLETAILYFDNLTDERGFQMEIKPKWIIVGPLYKLAAREILGSSQKPYTAENEINAMRQEDLQSFICHYFTDVDQWFVCSAKGDHDLNVWIRTPIETEPGDDYDTDDGKFKAFQRFSVGFGEYYGIYGSSGA